MPSRWATSFRSQRDTGHHAGLAPSSLTHSQPSFQSSLNTEHLLSAVAVQAQLARQDGNAVLDLDGFGWVKPARDQLAASAGPFVVTILEPDGVDRPLVAVAGVLPDGGEHGFLVALGLDIGRDAQRGPQLAEQIASAPRDHPIFGVAQ